MDAFFHIFLILCFLGVSQSQLSRYVISNAKATFFDAFTRCKQYNMDPVEILSEKDELDIEAFLPTITNSGNDRYWIFATNLGNKENFVWLDSGKPILYANYNMDEPNNARDKEHCLALVGIEKTKKYKWNDISCDAKLSFICKFRPPPRNCVLPTAADFTLVDIGR